MSKEQQLGPQAYASEIAPTHLGLNRVALVVLWLAPFALMALMVPRFQRQQEFLEWAHRLHQDWREQGLSVEEFQHRLEIAGQNPDAGIAEWDDQRGPIMRMVARETPVWTEIDYIRDTGEVIRFATFSGSDEVDPAWQPSPSSAVIYLFGIALASAITAAVLALLARWGELARRRAIATLCGVGAFTAQGLLCLVAALWCVSVLTG